MFRITMALMRKSARMLVPAGIAVLIGTAFIACTFLFANAMDDSLKTQATAQYAAADHVIVPDRDALAEVDDTTVNDAYGTTAGDLDVNRLRAADGIRGVRIDTGALVEASHGGKHATVQTIADPGDARLLPVDVTGGTAPGAAGGIALPESIADLLDVTVGDTVSLTPPADAGAAEPGGPLADGPLKVRVTGVTHDPTGLFSYYGGAGILPERETAWFLGLADAAALPIASGVYLDTDPAQRTEALKTIRQAVPEHYRLMDRATVDEEAMRAYDLGGTSAVTIFLMAFGVLALLVAALVIANTFQVLVAQRRRTLALLRTIGANTGQLYRSVVLEAATLGVLASLLGVAAGTGIMALVTETGLLESMGLHARLVMSWQVVAVPLAFGTLMTMLASLGAARAATAVTPMEALRPMDLTERTRRAGRVRGVLGALMIVAGAAATVAAVVWVRRNLTALSGSTADADAYQLWLLAAIAGCALVFAGLVVTAVFWLPHLIKGAGWIVSHAGPAAVIADANIQRNPRRIAATGAALLIGVTLVSTIATGAASGKATMTAALDTRYSVDVILSGPGVDTALTDQVRAVDGVKAVADMSSATGRFKDSGKDQGVLLLGAKNLAQVGSVVNADLAGARLDRGTALFPAYSATTGAKLHFAGGSVDITPDGGAATADGADAAAVRLAVSQADYRRISDLYAASAFVSADLFVDGTLAADGHMALVSLERNAGRDLSAVFADIQSVASKASQVTVAGPAAERETWEQSIDAMMALLVALLAVAVLIALIGVANTLSLSVIERTRESATLRAIGMTCGQLRRSLAIEALLIAVVSGLVGLVAGTLFGWAGSQMVFSLLGDGGVSLSVEWGVDGAVLAISVLAALLASVFPARRAVRTPPVEALAEA
ncbi:FtsX-like permease family protein [Bifidobacterium pullorum subsp. saeculare]|uniref:FtsX-like permease family protein n=1 Tax=Bifidobacterium pullorum subsp. saeculare TaxID=78257 RepID=A0A939BAH0_9BIFI|nr:FtsX-like permease family protein [Bifidobacterium pullorum]MBM6699876.1 FtsX-like permease family protein [Bifidobacterium pullorum subsp. saeculare]